jgi:hypothetical protein
VSGDSYAARDLSRRPMCAMDYALGGSVSGKRVPDADRMRTRNDYFEDGQDHVCHEILRRHESGPAHLSILQTLEVGQFHAAAHFSPNTCVNPWREMSSLNNSGGAFRHELFFPTRAAYSPILPGFKTDSSTTEVSVIPSVVGPW